MEVIDDRHGRGSTIVATQIPTDRWPEQIGDPIYADAIMDRLLHNAYRLVMKGKSMRGPDMRPETEEEAPHKIIEQVNDLGKVIPVTHAIHRPSHLQKKSIVTI